MAAARIPSWTDLTDQRRRDLIGSISALKSIARQLPNLCGGATPETLVMGCATLNCLIYAAQPRSLGFEPSRFSNVVSALRYILRRLGRHAPEERGYNSLTPAWRELHSALPSLYRQLPLIGFMRFCSMHGIEPGQVVSSTLQDYEDWCAAWTIDDDIGGKARRAATNWAWARTKVAGWPQAELARPNQKELYTLPLDAYPASFQADMRLYADRLAFKDNEDVFSADMTFTAGKPKLDRRSSFRSRRRTLKPRTIETRVSGIRFAAAALVHSGHSLDSLTSLRDLVEPPGRVRTILTFHRERLKQQRAERIRQGARAQQVELKSSHLANIAEVLRQIAQFHCRLPEDQVDQITQWAKRVSPPQQAAMVSKNRERLRRLIEPRPRALLLHLPAHLMKRAADPNLKPAVAARYALYATALEILLICPLRRQNLAELDINRSLRRHGGQGSAIARLHVPANEVKNESEIDWPLPPESARLIQTYLTRHRPHLADAANLYLFPSKGARARNAHELGIALSELIEREIGAPVHVHLLRHFAVWNYLNDNPGNYELVRQVLGHRSIATTIAAYAGLEADAAAREFDATVLENRRASRGIAAAAYNRRRRSVPKAPPSQGAQ